ncbi:hypothetical protein SLS63_012200 [Diaporthe eres]|uniref:Uncharacterized protein n=1 Tax=Diaporthe eres TaxID=83184 RepID=A0ABR1NS01_DIAER
MPSSDQPGPSSGLGNSRHHPGPSSGSNNSHSQDYNGGGEVVEAQDGDEQRPPVKRRKTRRGLRRRKRNLEQVPDRFSTGVGPDNVDHQAEASNAVGNVNEASATNASTSTSRNPSSARGAIASKADTARATGNAFRGSKEVSGRAASNSQTGFGVPGGTLASTFGSHPDPTTGPSRNNTAPYRGEASSSRRVGSSSMAPGSLGSASTASKRPAPIEDDNLRPKKRTHTSGGPLSGAADSPGQHASRREPGRDRSTVSSARQNPSFSDYPRDPLSRRDGSDERPAADTARYSNLNAPSRRAVAAQEFTWSNRYRDQRHEAPAQPMTMLNLGHSVSASGSRSLDPMPPPPRRDDNAAPRASPAGNSGSRARLLDSWRPDSGSLSRRTSGAAGNSQQPQGFNGWDRANRGGYPPRSD